MLDGDGYISTKWADYFSPYNANQILKWAWQIKLLWFGSIYYGGSNIRAVSVT
jgi:hypothetical protein